MRRCHPVVLAAALTLLAASGDCALDQAQVHFIPPDTYQVLATYRCGAITCWQRWIEKDGKRLGESRVCEADTQDGKSDLRAADPLGGKP